MITRAVLAATTQAATRARTPAYRSIVTMAESINAEAGPSTPPSTTLAQEPEQVATTAYDKWHKKNGPPVGSTMGARYLTGDQDPFDHNAW